MTATSIATVAPELAAGTWQIDPAHSEVTFSIRHLMSKVRGTFTEFEGSLAIAGDLAACAVSAQVKMDSVDTRNGQRDAHIRSAEILDIDNHPVMSFAATGVREEAGEYRLDGELTIKGVSRPISLDLEFNGVGEDPWGGTRAGFTATTTINRKDWGIEFNVPFSGDKVLLSDTVDIQLEIQAVRA